MMKDRFLDLIGKYSKDSVFNTKCWKEIFENHNSKSRYYHNLEHLKNMIEELKEVKFLATEIDTILFSIYYHDIIYKSTKSDNEYKSALFFKERISKTSFSAIEKCCTQIKATKRHEKSEDEDTNILLDLDLSILGSTEMVYKTYCQNIRKEYRIYPKFMYQKGRIKVLQKMLDAVSIYKTAYFVGKYEEKARKNMIAELDQLR